LGAFAGSCEELKALSGFWSTCCSNGFTSFFGGTIFGSSFAGFSSASFAHAAFGGD